MTATAALDTGRYQPDSRVSGKNGKMISGVPLNNFGGEDFGDIDLTYALTNSVNTVWAEVGEKLGKNDDGRVHAALRLLRASRRWTIPTDQMVASAACAAANGKLLPLTLAAVDVGRMAIGQGELLVTPLQMATVAQTIANGGVRMEPRLMAEGRRPRRPHASTSSSPRRPSA